tara:strand:+ start:456 stop:650 length:195 start_codon:yes stop_codon:yes gene_type:complete
MAKIQVRKVYERPALVEIGSMADKTEFFFSPDFFEKLFAIKKHYFYKKHGGRPDWGHHHEPEFS